MGAVPGGGPAGPSPKKSGSQQHEQRSRSIPKDIARLPSPLSSSVCLSPCLWEPLLPRCRYVLYKSFLLHVRMPNGGWPPFPFLVSSTSSCFNSQSLALATFIWRYAIILATFFSTSYKIFPFSIFSLTSYFDARFLRDFFHFLLLV